MKPAHYWQSAKGGQPLGASDCTELAFCCPIAPAASQYSPQSFAPRLAKQAARRPLARRVVK